MDLTSKKIIKKLLEKYRTRPFKGWGQNFLIDKRVLKKIIDSANLKKSDIILEIGPGIGTLTQEIAKKAKKVITIEKDEKMIQILRETLVDFKNIEIIHADILTLDPKPYTLRPYKIVANLPYYIVSPVIRKFLESVEVLPQQMILMAQKEVTQRICAKPPKMSILAVSVQFYAKPKIISYVSKNSFWPQPKVDSAILRIKKGGTVPEGLSLKPGLVDSFFKIVKAGFSQPRKQLANNLSNGLQLNKERVKEWLLKNGVKPVRRAETLSIKDWIKLTKNLCYTKNRYEKL